MNKKYPFYFSIIMILGSFFVCVVILIMNVPSVTAEERLSISGLTEPVNDVTLSLEVGGRISKIFFKEGDQIPEGEVILELNKRLEELEVQRRRLIWESKDEVNSATEKEKTLKSLLDSTRTLFEKMGSVSREELETKELEYKLIVIEQEGLEIAEEREQIEYKMALANLDKLILKSPINGIVTELFLDEGEDCEPHQPLVHLVDYSKCILVCYIESTLGENLTKGQDVDLDVPVGSRRVQRKGRVIFISPVVDPSSDLITIKVEFDNQDGSVRPGVAASMVIPVHDTGQL